MTKIFRFAALAFAASNSATAEEIFIGGNNFGPIDQIEFHVSSDPAFGINRILVIEGDFQTGGMRQMDVNPQHWRDSINGAIELQFTGQAPDSFDFEDLPSIIWELSPTKHQNCTPNNDFQFICGPVPVPPSPHPFLQCPGPNCPTIPDDYAINSAAASAGLAMTMLAADSDDDLLTLNVAALIRASTGFEPKTLSDEEAQFGWSSVALVGGMGGAFCTGVAVSPSSVITAAHCTCGKINSNKLSAIVMGPDLMSQRSVVLNVIGQAQTFQEGYCLLSEAEQSVDLALIAVETEFGPIPKDFIAPIRFDASYPMNRAILFGFGKTNSNNNGGERAAFIYDLVESCDQEAAREVKCSIDIELFSKLPVGVIGGGCGGDSGGPIFDNSGHLIAIELMGIDRSIDHQFNCGGGGIFLDLGSAVTNSEGQTIEGWLNENL